MLSIEGLAREQIALILATKVVIAGSSDTCGAGHIPVTE